MPVADDLVRATLFVLGVAVTSAPDRAHAASPDDRLAFAQAVVSAEAGPARRNRLLVGGLALGGGGLTATMGGVLLARHGRLDAAVLMAQGGVVLAGGTYSLLWHRDPFEELQMILDRMRAAGPASPESLHALQLRWYQLALAERRWRRLEGGASTIAAGGLFAAATVFVAAPGGMDPLVRGLYTRTLLVSGVGFLGAGLSRLLIPSGVERSYVAFAGVPASPAVSLSLSPGPGGLSLGGTF